MPSYRIAVIPGDGIGKEVVPEGQRVLEAAGRKYGVEFDWDEYPWGCEYFSRNGRMMPDDGLDRIRHHDAIFLGAVGSVRARRGRARRHAPDRPPAPAGPRRWPTRAERARAAPLREGARRAQ